MRNLFRKITAAPAPTAPLSTGPRILVAGLPRCGTTLLFRSLAGLPPGPYTPKDYTGPIHKTHHPDAASWPEVDKAVFLFGDVIHSVISTRLNRYDAGHFRNCGSTADPAAVDIFAADVLSYEKIFDAWQQQQAFPLLCLRYERLYENVAVLEHFLGAPVELPAEKRRKTSEASVARSDVERIRRTYASLIAKVEAAPDVSIRGARRGPAAPAPGERHA